MYPFIRLAKELAVHRRAPPLKVGETHVTHLICWPWDIDLWLELNNGRTLTIMDLGRVVLFRRMGVIGAMRARGWAGTIAGASVRYRRRVRMFDRIEMRSRILGWDDRFTYAEQSLWRDGECCSHALLRMAITGGRGIVPSAELARALGLPEQGPPLPAWVAAWIAAEAERPWPPMQP
ncbi:MAG: acyl-CoA thioesterase [Rhodobacteraceae bacterium]|nr:acyl-CoA thioesterase [Paracoccaceae bacterium]